MSETTTAIQTKLVTEHMEGCDAVAAVLRGDWDTPWWLPGETEYRDSIGRKVKHAYHRWLVAECNDPECPGRLLIHEGAMLAAVAP